MREYFFGGRADAAATEDAGRARARRKFELPTSRGRHHHHPISGLL